MDRLFSIVQYISLKDSVISLQQMKIQSQEKMLDVKNKTIESFKSTLKLEWKVIMMLLLLETDSTVNDILSSSNQVH